MTELPLTEMRKTGKEQCQNQEFGFVHFTFEVPTKHPKGNVM